MLLQWLAPLSDLFPVMPRPRASHLSTALRLIVHYAERKHRLHRTDLRQRLAPPRQIS